MTPLDFGETTLVTSSKVTALVTISRIELVPEKDSVDGKTGVIVCLVN